MVQEGTTSTPKITTMISTTEPMVTTTAAMKDCPDGWSKNGTSCYWIVEYEMDWVAAQDVCKQLSPGAHLASSGSAVENDFLRHLYTATGSTWYIWLGATDSSEEGTWSWTDGTAFNYTYWYSGEGSDGANHNCLAMNVWDYWNNDYFGKWFDRGCFDSNWCICEIDQA